MLALAVLSYFLLACAILWLIAFPDARLSVTRQLQQLARAARMRMGRRKALLAHATDTCLTGAGSSLHRLRSILQQNPLLVTTAVALLTLPPVAALLLSGKTMLGGFDEATRETNFQVAQLLQGEELVPPPALPPELFVTAEVAQVRPMLITASRNWQLLNGEYARRLLLVFRIMKEKHGYDMAILEGYRSPQRQTMLREIGESVTNAGAYQSFHQFGLAGDCAFLRNGKLVISEKDPWAMEGYRLYGQVAESVGLTWGGRWKMMDFGHTELRLPGFVKK